MYENIILIPYRDRKEHLDYFIKNAWPLIDEHVNNPKLVILEQEEGKQFNRGKLLNVGFKEYENQTKYFITHDVDVIPKKEALRIYNDINSDIIRIMNPHKYSLGCITKISNDSINKINGFPNHIWGWGIEDRALFYRAKIFNVSMNDMYNHKHEFTFLYHKSNAHMYTNEKKNISDTENHIFNHVNYDEQIKHIMKSGLNNLDYTIIDRKIYNGYEIIKVSI